MPDRPRLSRFLSAPVSRKLLSVEAAFELVLARLNTLGSARHFTRLMGELEGRPIEAQSAQQDRAAAIGHVVALTARMMPFRAVCLQQVLAVRRMLRRRHIPSTVVLGVIPGKSAPDSVLEQPASRIGSDGMTAHAWIKTGDRVVNGQTPDLDSYVVLGVFS
ncbi:MAG: lasso peptide biosynthesis B2 protein [Pseudomonadota bacterium]